MVQRPKRVKEVVIERDLVMRVEALGGLCLKVGVLGRRGFVDRLVLLPGRVLFVELKRPRGARISPHQIKCMDAIKRLGLAIAIVRTPEDIAALLAQY